MQSRKLLLDQFVFDYFSGAEYIIDKIIGDAGLRNYYRLKLGEQSYIIMDCPPDYTSIEPFIFMSKFLIANNFAAPKIVHSDITNGFLILEDFGSSSIKDLLNKVDYLERKNIYYLTLDLLVNLQKIDPPKELKICDLDLLILELEVFTNYYISHKTQKKLTSEEIVEFNDICRSVLQQRPISNQVIVLRDYHVENIMFLKQEMGIKKLGLLDFQDALIGSPLYDVVSILEDARIIVDRNFALDCLSYYVDKMKYDMQQSLASYHILGTQRNLRILGVFARKYIRDNDDSYLQYMPTVLNYLSYDLSHEVLLPLKKWLLKKQLI